jgi:hypothetical protein
MSSHLPAPDFDAQNYARPNQDWICGHACEGVPCRLGPDARGRCRATAECKPVLETKPGETKGRWRCTRPEGACETGPLPDGTCCRPISPCSPVATLRWWRGRLTLAMVAASCAALLILLGNPPWRNGFINPGEMLAGHSGTAFALLAETNHLNPGCGACHVAGNSGPGGMVQAAGRAQPGVFDLKALALAAPAAPTAMDDSCLKCHAGKNFHQPDASAVSCSLCHLEHQGMTLAATTDANCDFCHADAAKMAVSRTAPVIHHFAEDHPQFRFLTDHARDPDTLRFNHELHLTSPTIPLLTGGQKLDCAFCHQLDTAGAYMRPVNFEQNCRVCHSLQFDPDTPQLQLPHGSVEFVSAFLHSLPEQYRELAAKQNAADAGDFAAKKLAGLRAQFGSGEELERRVFFSTATFGPEAQIGSLSGGTRAVFPGCAYCHEVKTSTAGRPEVTKPVIPDRWLAQAKFNHAKHAGISCEQCHEAVHSRETADILLPPKETCQACHSPQGGVADTCAECHTYHHSPAFKPQMAMR